MAKSRSGRFEEIFEEISARFIRAEKLGKEEAAQQLLGRLLEEAASRAARDARRHPAGRGGRCRPTALGEVVRIRR